MNAYNSIFSKTEKSYLDKHCNNIVFWKDGERIFARNTFWNNGESVSGTTIYEVKSALDRKTVGAKS